ncbi:MAG: hypothetical protein HGA31_02690 [Candidatus Moranbacteria bacterium]|nr:hypothetical protein [Candidatus Moranbacteria bacterium]
MIEPGIDDAEVRNRKGDMGEPAFPFRFLERFAPWLLPTAVNLSFILFERDAEKIHAVLDKSRRIDIEPLSGSGRGFRLIVDRRTAYIFHQEGDGFDYDGYEVGDFEKGDVTIFDDLNENGKG